MNGLGVFYDVKEAMKSVIEHIDLHNYVCVDDYLVQIGYSGDISIIKEQLKKIFRNKHEIDIEKFEDKHTEYLKFKVQHEGIIETINRSNLRGINEQIKRIDTEIEYKSQELNNGMDELHRIKQERHFLQNIKREIEFRLDEIFQQESSNKEINSHIKALKNELHVVEKDLVGISRKMKQQQALIKKLKSTLNTLKERSLQLKGEKESRIRERRNKRLEFSELEKVLTAYREAKRDLKFYLNFQFHEENKLYIYNLLKYRLEIIKAPQELQRNLRKFRHQNFEISNKYNKTIEKLIDNKGKFKDLVNFYQNLDYANVEQYSDGHIAKLIYEFVEAYTFNKLYDFSNLKGTVESTLFYRGQSNSNYLTTPSIFRSDELIQNEHILYHEINVKCPTDIQNSSSHLEILATMQHYSLPTRLLDITSSPLTATFFALEDAQSIEMDCELIVSKVANEDIKYYDSDTVEILSTISTLRYKEKQELLFEAFKSIMDLINEAFSVGVKEELIGAGPFLIDDKVGNVVNKFNKKAIVKKLNNEIRKEWRTELNDINPIDILRICFVKPKQNNNRIIRQQGAFIVSGLMGKRANIEAFDNYRLSIKSSAKYLKSIYDLLDVEIKEEYFDIDFEHFYVKPRLIIPSSRKKTFKDWLMDLGIDETSIYPEFEKVAGYLKAKYSY